MTVIMRRSHRKARTRGQTVATPQGMECVTGSKGLSVNMVLAPVVFFFIGILFLPTINMLMDLTSDISDGVLKSQQTHQSKLVPNKNIVSTEQASSSQGLPIESHTHEQVSAKNEGLKIDTTLLDKIETELQQNISILRNKSETNVSPIVNVSPPAHKHRVPTDRLPSKDDLLSELSNFVPTILPKLAPREVTVDGRILKPVELEPTRTVKTGIKAYIYDDFLSADECRSLIRVHRRHIDESLHPPLLCFDSLDTLQYHLVDHNATNMHVTEEDFIEGTWCVNASLSEQLTKSFSSNWSYSTAFYPGESRFSEVFEQRVTLATGLPASNGGKFQLTSYPPGKGYKTHTDCIVGSSDKRDRAATILVYLQDVVGGGETEFPELGISVRPKRGRALVWMNMDERGDCDPTSVHQAAQVRSGHKYILQRWYYYHSFFSLGRRPQEPHIPHREPKQPRVTCDEYRQGSCRWYDEWDYDHIMEYRRLKRDLL